MSKWNDEFGRILSEFGELFPLERPMRSFREHTTWVDTDKYDLLLKPKYLDKEIASKEEELRTLEEYRKHYNARADEMEQKKRQEIDNLKAQKNKRIIET